MKEFLVYDIDGNIKRCGSCVASDLPLQAREGEFVVEHPRVSTDQYLFIDGEVIEKVIPPKTNDELLTEVQKEIRMQRASLLRASDWTQVPDAPVDQQAWATYRQALRDLPAQYQNETDFANVVFPNPPE